MSKNKRKNIIRRILIGLVSVAMVVCFISLFVAASKDRNKASCKGIAINVGDKNTPVFVNEKEIRNIIVQDKKINPIGKKLSDLNIRQIEHSVKMWPWVKNANLYMDNHNILEIDIEQRSPVARIFTSTGTSFYIDEEKTLLPVNGSFALKLPVFTGFNNSITAERKDSALFDQILDISHYITNHAFWMAQVDQININSHGNFELIPTVGSVLIEFGDGNKIEEKFNKLLAFYKKGLNNIGWGNYDTLSLQYSGQVVATRKRNNSIPVIDSLLTKDGYNQPENKLK